MRDSAPDGSSPRDCALLLAMEDNLKSFLSYTLLVEQIFVMLPMGVTRLWSKRLSSDRYALGGLECISDQSAHDDVRDDVFWRLHCLTRGGVRCAVIDGT